MFSLQDARDLVFLYVYMGVFTNESNAIIFCTPYPRRRNDSTASRDSQKTGDDANETPWSQKKYDYMCTCALVGRVRGWGPQAVSAQ